MILASQRGDAEVISFQLASEGIESFVVSAAEIVEAIVGGELGAAVITDESVELFDVAALTRALDSQPPWSDCQFLLLTSQQSQPQAKAAAISLLGNVVKMERPLNSGVLISGVRSALRARARQRKAEVYLREREDAEARFRRLATTLEGRVLKRTRALAKALVKRSEAEARLVESEELYRHTVELGSQIPWTADADGAVLSVGAAWLARIGRSLDEMTSDPWREGVHLEDRELVRMAWAAALEKTSPFLCEFRLRRADGTHGWCRARAAPRFSEDRRVIRWYGTLEDIDERRESLLQMQQLQSELIHVSRVNAMGAMASTIAHELNQPLTAIANYVRGVRRMLPEAADFDEVREALKAADANAVRAGEIVRRVRELVANGRVDHQRRNLAEIISAACGMAMIDARSGGINYRVDVDIAVADVMVDRVQIQQVLFNLLRNASEALARSSIREIVVAAAWRSSTSCEVTVRDTGPGVPVEAQYRLFEPFNTTKNEGMGIGLSISRTIIQAHGGEIWYESPPEGGALFGFTLTTFVEGQPRHPSLG